MERQSYDADRVSETRRIPYRTAKKLERSYKVNGSSLKEYEEAIWPEIKEPLRIEGWRQHVAGE